MQCITKRFRVALAMMIVVAGVLTFYHHQRQMYPYGSRSAALPVIVNCLRVYAHDHGNSFPDADGDPYRSLELLYPDYISADLLAGLSGDRDKATFALTHGGHLSPENCSLIYVPGMLDTDDENIAIVWEIRTGITFNGQAWPGRAVGIINGQVHQIPDDKWDEFIAQQKRMRESAMRGRKRMQNSERLIK